MALEKVDGLSRRLNDIEPLGAETRDALYKAFSRMGLDNYRGPVLPADWLRLRA